MRIMLRQLSVQRRLAISIRVTGMDSFSSGVMMEATQIPLKCYGKFWILNSFAIMFSIRNFKIFFGLL